MIEDIISGLRFIADISNCPGLYKAKIENLSSLLYNSELKEDNVDECIEFFRKENLKYIQKNNDMFKFAAAFMMLCTALSTAIWKRDKAIQKAHNAIHGRKLVGRKITEDLE